MTAPHWWNYALEAAYFTSYTAVAVKLKRCRVSAEWSALFAYCVATSVMTVLTVALQGRASTYAAYFWMHWTGESIRSLLMLAVFYQTVHTVPLVRQIPHSLRSMFGVAICTCVAVAALITAAHAPSRPYALTSAAMALEQCSSIAWGIFATGMIAAISLVGLAWTDMPLRIASGALWQTMAAIAISFAIGHDPEQRVALTILSDCLHLCVLPYWYWAIRPNAVTPDSRLIAIAATIPGLSYDSIPAHKGNTP